MFAVQCKGQLTLVRFPFNSTLFHSLFKRRERLEHRLNTLGRTQVMLQSGKVCPNIHFVILYNSMLLCTPQRSCSLALTSTLLPLSAFCSGNCVLEMCGIVERIEEREGNWQTLNGRSSRSVTLAANTSHTLLI